MIGGLIGALSGKTSARVRYAPVSTKPGREAIQQQAQQSGRQATAQGYALAASARGSSSPLALREAQRRGAMAQQAIGANAGAMTKQLEQGAMQQNSQNYMAAQQANAQIQQANDAGFSNLVRGAAMGGAGLLLMSDARAKDIAYAQGAADASGGQPPAWLQQEAAAQGWDRPVNERAAVDPIRTTPYGGGIGAGMSPEERTAVSQYLASRNQPQPAGPTALQASPAQPAPRPGPSIGQQLFAGGMNTFKSDERSKDRIQELEQTIREMSAPSGPASQMTARRSLEVAPGPTTVSPGFVREATAPSAGSVMVVRGTAEEMTPLGYTPAERVTAPAAQVPTPAGRPPAWLVQQMETERALSDARSKTIIASLQAENAALKGQRVPMQREPGAVVPTAPAPAQAPAPLQPHAQVMTLPKGDEIAAKQAEREWLARTNADAMKDWLAQQRYAERYVDEFRKTDDVRAMRDSNTAHAQPKEVITSDERAKEGGGYGEMDFPDGVKAVAYKYKPEFEGMPGAPPGEHVGILAQDLEKTPEGRTAVVDDPETGMKQVEMPDLLMLLTAKVAELDKKLDEKRGGGADS